MEIVVPYTYPQKGAKEIFDNYRGIAVAATVSRMYRKLLKDGIEYEYVENQTEEQVDHLFRVIQRIKKISTFNPELHLLFINLKKAYDSITLAKLREVFDRSNLYINLIRSVKELLWQSQNWYQNIQWFRTQ